jgi:hypothetical protein
MLMSSGLTIFRADLSFAPLYAVPRWFMLGLGGDRLSNEVLLMSLNASLALEALLGFAVILWGVMLCMLSKLALMLVFVLGVVLVMSSKGMPFAAAVVAAARGAVTW